MLAYLFIYYYAHTKPIICNNPVNLSTILKPVKLLITGKNVPHEFTNKIELQFAKTFYNFSEIHQTLLIKPNSDPHFFLNIPVNANGFLLCIKTALFCL